MIASLELVKILEQRFSRQEAERTVTLLDTQSAEQMKQVYMTKGDKIDLTDRINKVSVDLNDRIDVISADLIDRINAVSTDLIDRINAVSIDLNDKINVVAMDLTEKVGLVSTRVDHLEIKLLSKMEANFRWLAAVMLTGIATTATIVKLIS